jgi:hypothetical protein
MDASMALCCIRTGDGYDEVVAIDGDPAEITDLICNETHPSQPISEQIEAVRKLFKSY